MTSKSYKIALTQAQKELAETVHKRDYLNLEIVRLQNLVKGLALSAEKSEKTEQMAEVMKHQLGITQIIKAILNQSSEWLSPVQVRDELRRMGFELSHYANPMALIHQSLIRLAADGRIRCVNGTYARGEFMEKISQAFGF